MSAAKPKMSVDEYIQAKVLPEFQPAAALARELMRQYAPEAQEIFSYNMPCYRLKHLIAYISASKTGIALGFVHGAQFEDRYGLLRGEGKSNRHVKFKDPAAANREALRDYIAQAVALDGA